MHRYICRKKTGAQQQQKQQQQQQQQMQMQQPKLLLSPEKVVAKLKISSPPIFLQQVEEEAKVEKDIHVFDFDLVISQVVKKSLNTEQPHCLVFLQILSCFTSFLF